MAEEGTSLPFMAIVTSKAVGLGDFRNPHNAKIGPLGCKPAQDLRNLGGSEDER